jgi:hypothetical protein
MLTVKEACCWLDGRTCWVQILGEWNLLHAIKIGKVVTTIPTATGTRAGMCLLYAIFAWNEWGEGAVLEPNTAEGTRLGEAVARARREAERLHGEDRA